MENKGRRILSILGTIILVCMAIYLRYQQYESEKLYQAQIRATQIDYRAENEKAIKWLNAFSEQVKAAEKLKGAEMDEDISQGYKIVKLNGKFLIVKNLDVDKATELKEGAEGKAAELKDKTLGGVDSLINKIK